MVDEKKRLFFTAIVISLVGIVTGLFLGGGLLPSQAAQQYNESTTTSKKGLSIVHSHDGISQHEHPLITVVTVTETTPHGTSHDFATAMLSPNGGQAQADSGPKQAADEIWIWAREFRPNTLTVSVGTKVTWTNKEAEDHTVTSSKAGLFDGGLGPYGSFSYTFTEPGSFEYYCGPHNQMTGVIIVK